MKVIIICFFTCYFPIAYSIPPNYGFINPETPVDRLKTCLVKSPDLSYNKVGPGKDHFREISFTSGINGVISVSPASLYDNDVEDGDAAVNRTVYVKNNGTGVLSISSIIITGNNTSHFVLSGLPTFPYSINAGDSVSFFIAFAPTSTGLKTISININSDDALNPSISIPFRGLGTPGVGGTNEPSLQSLLNLLEIETNAGDDDISTAVINSNTSLQKDPLLGDEVRIQKFQKAGPGNVTITPLAVFGPTANATITAAGWYISGNVSSKTELFSVFNNPVSNGQTVNVNFTGSLSFDPAANTFGFYSRWPFFSDRHLYSEDNLNTFSGAIPHHVRVYPYKKNGTAVPDAYLIAFEEHISGFDYQDLLFLVHNVKQVQYNSSLFVENLDGFPSNNDFVFSRIQIPWSRDSINYNSNHDSLKVRIHNKGINPLTITGLNLSNDTTWKIDKINTTTYTPALLPRTLSSGTFVDVTLKFIATDQASRIKVLEETLTILSYDDKNPVKRIVLHGIWQQSGEGNNEPYAQEIIRAFGFTTNTGFVDTDPDLGDSTKLKGDEIKPSYFVTADPSKPVSIRQMAAYHGCCLSSEKFMWYPKGSDTTLNIIFTHIDNDGQTLLPRRSLSGFSASGTISPATPFGFKVGFVDLTDASKNPGKKIGIRVWRAYDADSAIIPNSYILSNDYLGSESTNFDYNDNMYFVTNLKPETGSASFSTLEATPSAVDFNDKIVLTANTLPLTLKSLGQTYSNGSVDPVIRVSSMQIIGENSAEFSVGPLLDSTLNPQQTSSLTVTFNPLTQGLKIADLLIYYDNSLSPLRVPLYGIARAADSAVVVNYRIKGGAANPIVVNGKTWSADTPFAFDNLEPYTNPALTQIAATDDDALYLSEQSSDSTKRPFRYAINVPNGKYVVRLHFAEIFWGVSGPGFTGGAGSRVFSVMLENQYRLVNYDIVQEAGAASAVIKNFPVTVTDGKINIDFSASVNRPMVSAVEIYSFVFSGPLASGDVLNLKGTVTDKVIELDWVNNNETLTSYYEIHRSTNNIDFTIIATVPAINAADYNYIDGDPDINNNFYRIKQVSLDGKFTYSNIIRLDFSKILSIKLFPSPATDKISIQFSGIESKEKAMVIIQSFSGSTTKRIPFTLSNNKQLEIDISTLSSGIYTMQIISNTVSVTRKFLKKN